MASSPSPTPGKFRSPSNLRKLSRSPQVGRWLVSNHFDQVVDRLAETHRFPRLSAYLPQNLWPWVWSYLSHAFSKKAKFRTYPPGDGVHQLGPGPIRIAIAGDWASGTEEAATVAALMEHEEPDVTIHLGDVYYVGDKPEVEEKCLGLPREGYTGVSWPAGSRGSFALNGNHEMYANGEAYFNTFLPTLGLKVNGKPSGQKASYLALEAGDWRIVGIDTGYNSAGVPLLGFIPLLNRLPFISSHGDCHLEPELVQWLGSVLASPKPTVILSHHQRFSAFPGEQEYPKPAQQLVPLLSGQEFVWIWGHEHRLGIYDRHTTTEGLTFSARCAGHGGMPVEPAKPDPDKLNEAPLRYYDPRTHPLGKDGPLVGENGFLLVVVSGDTLRIEYFDLTGRSLLTEEFKRGSAGALAYTLVGNPSGLTKM